MTGPIKNTNVSFYSGMTWIQILTAKVAINGGFHQGFHPITEGSLFLRAEEMGFLAVMNYAESIPTRMCRLICNDLVALDVDVAFDACFLFITGQANKPENNYML